LKKNVSGQYVQAQMITAADGTAFTGTVTCYITLDNGSQTLGSVGSGVCTHKGNGLHQYAPSQGETNGDLVACTFIGTGAIPVTVQYPTTFPQTGDSYARIGAPAGASTAADIAAIKSDSGAIKTKTDYLPSAAAGGAGGVAIVGSVMGKSPATLAAGDVTGNLPADLKAITAGVDLSATMKTSVTTAATAATPVAASVAGAVGSVTGMTASDVGAVKAVIDNLATMIENVSGYRFKTKALEQSPAGADQSAVKRLIARNLGKDLVSVRGWTGIKVTDTLVDGQTGEDDNGATFVFYAVDPADVSSKVELGTFVFSAGTVGDGTAQNPGNGTFTPSANFAYPNYPGKDLYLAIVCSVSSQAHDGAHLENVNMHGHRFQVTPVGFYPMDPGDGSGGVTVILMNGLQDWMYWAGSDGWCRAEDHGQLYNQPTLGAVLAFPGRGYGSGIGLPGGALVLSDLDLDEPVTMTKLRQQALVNPQGIESLSVAGYETIGSGYIRIAVQGTVNGETYYQKLGTVDDSGFHPDAGWVAAITPDVSTLRLVIDRGTNTEACHLVFTAVDGGGNRRTIHYQHPGGAVSLALAGGGGAYNYDGTWPHEPPVPSSGNAGAAVGGGADSVTLTINDDQGAPIPGCSVWITSDLAGTVVIAGTLLTNDAGQVAFRLTDGVTYYCWRRKAGMNFAVNPAPFVAVED
jgi:hypothetical protein